MRTQGKTLTAALALASAGLLMRTILAGPRYSFRGRVVVITGGTRGLGLVIARKLAEEGARLVICSRSIDQLERAERELQARGVEVMAFHCDVTNRDDVEQLVDYVVSTWGRIDVLMNVAGVIQVGPMETMTLDDYRAAMDTHYWGPLYFIQSVLPSMRRQRGGRIVNVTSIGGRISVPHLLPYSASKFALTGLSEGMRAELAREGIVVTTVVPGLMRTGSPRNALFKGQHRAEYAWFALGDAFPLLSMSAESAARQIVEACRHGEASVTLSIPAKLAETFHGLFPGLTADLLGLVNRMLPTPGGIGKASARGAESQSWLAPSSLTVLNERAAVRNNEM